MANRIRKAGRGAALIVGLACVVPSVLGATSYARISPVKLPGAAPLFRIQRHGKWGFIDRTGQILIRPQFDDAGDFFDGRAPVRIGGQWGYVSENGALAIRPQYESAGTFRNGRAIVAVGGRFGAIDTDGRVRVTLRYESIRLLKSDRAAVAIRASKGDPQPNELHWALIDTDGATITPPLYDAIGDEYSEGLIAAAIAEPTPDRLNTRHSWGFVDTSGTWAISPRFGSAPTPFAADGRAVFVDPTTDRRGVIDRTGRIVCPPAFSFLSPWHDGFAVAKKNDRWLILDSNFGVAADVDVDQLEPFSEGLAEFRRHDQYGFLDTAGHVVVPPMFSTVFAHTDGFARVELGNERWGFVDRTGNLAIPARYNDVWEFSDGLALVQFEDKWHYINTSGEVIASNVLSRAR